MRRRLPSLTIAAALVAVTVALASGLPTGVAAAQTTAQDTADGPRIELSDAQRHTIWQSVSRTQKNHAAPTGFRVAVGATLPAGIDLAPMPDTLAGLMPEAKPFAVAMIEKQVVLVDPKSRQVAAVITEETR
ncbi:DUF1236 domain-containing protein [Rhodoplanes serenus]|uniref:DUF1236 domain-containing protein n=1 Tax=Rhodoplanes serenus TaxID=200615 RepID=UPI000DAEABBA|nr:DUF1236 domain-containing protein [Rhodoplanes serenus]RAI33875.1 hypothetical protein CH340_10780 [Rhodoplanes serenus]